MQKGQGAGVEEADARPDIQSGAQSGVQPDVEAGVFSARVMVLDDFGRHARPAAALAKTAQAFASEISLRSGPRSADAKSILDILSLAAGRGTELRVECRGPDAARALPALTRLFAPKSDTDHAV